jgi:hypothetical protein
MKTALLILFFSLNAFAQKPPPVAEEQRWLYDLLFTEADRAAQPAESFKSFWPHLLDSFAEFPHPDRLQAANLRFQERITGTITYAVVVKKTYVYDILQADDGTWVINVRVHLKDPVGEDFKNFSDKVKLAEQIWNEARLPFDFKYAFKFDVVENEADSMYSVNVLDTTRGPYDRNWGRNWSGTTVAHELGHMMGLGDEYQTLSGKIDCMRNSLMCVSGSGKIQPHHFYFILRRFVNSIQL